MRIFAGKGAVVAALALGALTSFLAWRYVDQASQNGQNVEMVPIVVAAMPIPARTVIAPEMLRLQRVPVDVVDPAAAHSAEDVVGKVARAPMTIDEPVLISKVFLQRAESGLAFMIPEGMRAVSVAFSEIVGSGGMVTPGDHVDIIGVFEKKQPAGSKDSKEESTQVATLVLQDVTVLAIAQRLEGENTKPKEAIQVPGSATEKPSQVRSEPAPQPAAKTATLAVNPSDALKVVLAEDRGRIRLALRRAEDKSTPIVEQVAVSALLEPATVSASVPMMAGR
ncbi:MAG TPA: Flp pilus assembly protein CpaB [Chloroflexota bacterium]